MNDCFWHDNDRHAYYLRPCEDGDADHVKGQLRAHDDAYAPPVSGVADERLVYVATDEDGMLVGGCGVTIDCWGVMAIDDLWVDKRHRKKGLGTALVRRAERDAQAKGCYLSLVGTFDFQAPNLYEKLGYELFNIWDDYPAGHANFSLAKRLRRGKTAGTHEEAPPPYAIASGEEEHGEYIADKVADFNHSRVPYLHAYQGLDKKVVSSDGAVIAGYCVGNSGWDVAILDMIWVDEAYRHAGLGTALLADAEREVKERGAYLVLSSAFDWQVGFFLSHGYTVTGELHDCPKGHVYYSLQKRL